MCEGKPVWNDSDDIAQDCGDTSGVWRPRSTYKFFTNVVRPANSARWKCPPIRFILFLFLNQIIFRKDSGMELRLLAASFIRTGKT